MPRRQENRAFSTSLRITNVSNAAYTSRLQQNRVRPPPWSPAARCQKQTADRPEDHVAKHIVRLHHHLRHVALRQRHCPPRNRYALRPGSGGRRLTPLAKRLGRNGALARRAMPQLDRGEDPQPLHAVEPCSFVLTYVSRRHFTPPFPAASGTKLTVPNVTLPKRNDSAWTPHMHVPSARGRQCAHHRCTFHPLRQRGRRHVGAQGTHRQRCQPRRRTYL